MSKNLATTLAEVEPGEAIKHDAPKLSVQQLASRFAERFPGYDKAHGEYKLKGAKDRRGKAEGRAQTLAGPVTLEMWKSHLKSEGAPGVGIIPLLADDTVRWGCIDIDKYPLDHKKLVLQISELNLPLAVFRSKSGGAHVFLFLCESVPAADVQRYLISAAASLGYDRCEIFPKQSSRTSAHDIGNWLNMPYYDARQTDRYAFDDNGEPIKSVVKGLDHADAKAIDAETFYKYMPEAAQPDAAMPATADDDDSEGPIVEGQRNTALTSIAGRLSWAGLKPDKVLAELLDINAKRCVPPLDDDEVADIAKSISRYENKAADVVRRGQEVPWPEKLGDAAYYGLAGQIVRAIAPHSEADPVALLLQLLVAFGNIIGRYAFYYVEGVRHHCNLFTLIVGSTSKGRKGTSWGQIRSFLMLTSAAGIWLKNCVTSGLSSGEGLIHVVRDPIIKTKYNKKTEEHEDEVVDEGVSDKRALIVETEFARVLRVMARPDNTLSSIVRGAWDGDDLRVMTRNSPLHATDPHISINAHVTIDDLKRYFEETDTANGFGNRFLFALAERVKLLPFGGDRRLMEAALFPLAERLSAVIEELNGGGNFQDPANFEDPASFRDPSPVELTWADDAARAAWQEFYEQEADERSGVVGALCARGEAQVVRLALLYALLDGERAIRVPHLAAAKEVWRYCVDSTRYVFGAGSGDPVAEKILKALCDAGSKGLSRNEIRNVFARHKSADKIDPALEKLRQNGQATSKRVETAGRPGERWHATGV